MTAYEAALESAALFDLSDRAKIELAGKDVRAFLHNLCTQDINNLPVGETREAFLTTNKARVIAHVWVTHRAQDVLWLDGAAGQADKLFQHFNHYLISEQVELADRTQELAMLRLIGPNAQGILTKLAITPARRHRLLALDGFDVFCPASDSSALRSRLLEAGAVLGDAATYNLLRMEAGLPEYGIDIDEDRLAMEVNRPDAISYAKGCYLGQETIVMARDRGQANRKMMGLTLSGNVPVPGNTKLFRGADEVGQITSSVFSPRLQKAIALAYLRRGSWDVGIEVTIDPNVAGAVGVVAALPFLALP
jgi:folate-binding protein YgfZ